MRGYIFGLLSGLMIMGAVWSCGPAVGPGDGGGSDAKPGDIGVKVGALSVKSVDLDCAQQTTKVNGTYDAVEVPGVEFDKVLFVLLTYKLKDGTTRRGSTLIFNKGGKTFAWCIAEVLGQKVTGTAILR